MGKLPAKRVDEGRVCRNIPCRGCNGKLAPHPAFPKGKALFIQPKMFQRLRQAVFHNIIRDIIRGLLGGITGVAHGHADTGVLQHRHVIAAVPEGDGLLPRQPQMGQRVGKAVRLAAACGQNVAEIRAPPHGQTAGAAAQKLRLVLRRQKGAELVDVIRFNAGGHIPCPLLQLPGKIPA